MHANRQIVLNQIAKKSLNSSRFYSLPQVTSEIFGEQVFGAAEMKNRLTKDVYQGLQKVMHQGAPLTPDLAKTLAEAVKSWALSKGVTHFTHWFQPLTGLTAEKHDSFLSFDSEGKAVEKFSASQLLQSEPDASSFPSGGMRSTFEARGYTAWDATSPLFIVENAGVKVLCVPSVFVSYTGHSLDTKTSLLRSIDSIQKATTEMLNEMIGDSREEKIKNTSVTIGCEQEYFLIDSHFMNARPDLLMAGRTLLGGDMPKGQQLEDHYFGSIPTRVQAFMADLETQLYRLGVPVKTRHNEVAPSQFEMAPIFEEANTAADHNMLSMEVMKRVAEKHGFACLLHEKPFAGVNGSGKHCNWSMQTNTGVNLLEPGQTPSSNFRFLAFLSCVLRGVFKNQIALRAAIASHGNDHRLGANEAPPAIISVFLGSTLNQIIDAVSQKTDLSKINIEKANIEFGINRLPSIPKDNTDRNRTSPFAFTGNKFEFRAVGSSQAISLPMTVLNAAVSDSIKEFTKRLRTKKTGAASIEAAILEVTREFFLESEKIRFEGDGYSDVWRDEASKRGLSQLLTTPTSLEAFSKKENHEFLIREGVFKNEEFHALLDVRYERYVKHLLIEAQALSTIVRQYIIPAAQRYQMTVAQSVKALEGVAGGSSTKNQKWLLSEISNFVEQCFDGLGRLANDQKTVNEQSSFDKKAKFIDEKLCPAMADLRSYCDKLESIVDDSEWPLPKYREMLFIR
jgi:glutamine synthetase